MSILNFKFIYLICVEMLVRTFALPKQVMFHQLPELSKCMCETALKRLAGNLHNTLLLYDPE